MLSRPTVTIRGLMTVALFVAVDCAALRALLDWRSPWGELATLGVVPMANVLAAAAWPLGFRGRGADGSRPPVGGFRAGFLAFGTAAMVAYWVGSAVFLNWFFPLPQRLFPSLRPGLGLASAVFALYSGPQLAFACLGGWLGRALRDAGRRREPGRLAHARPERAA